MRIHTGDSGIPSETQTIHEGIEKGLVFSEQDHLRFRLLNAENLGHGINVQLFQVNCMVPVARVTRRVLDKHLYDIQQHPVLMAQDSLEQLIGKKPHEINEHVKVIVTTLLSCKSVTAPHLQRNKKGITALQYITLQNFKCSAEGFNHHTHDNFVKFVRNTFFSQVYLRRVLAHKTEESDEVIAFP